MDKTELKKKMIEIFIQAEKDGMKFGTSEKFNIMDIMELMATVILEELVLVSTGIGIKKENILKELERYYDAQIVIINKYKEELYKFVEKAMLDNSNPLATYKEVFDTALKEMAKTNNITESTVVSYDPEPTINTFIPPVDKSKLN